MKRSHDTAGAAGGSAGAAAGGAAGAAAGGGETSAQSSEVEITISNDPRADILMSGVGKKKTTPAAGGYAPNYQPKPPADEPPTGGSKLYPSV